MSTTHAMRQPRTSRPNLPRTVEEKATQREARALVRAVGRAVRRGKAENDNIARHEAARACGVRVRTDWKSAGEFGDGSGQVLVMPTSIRLPEAHADHVQAFYDDAEKEAPFATTGDTKE